MATSSPNAFWRYDVASPSRLFYSIRVAWRSSVRFRIATAVACLPLVNGEWVSAMKKVGTPKNRTGNDEDYAMRASTRIEAQRQPPVATPPSSPWYISYEDALKAINGRNYPAAEEYLRAALRDPNG